MTADTVRTQLIAGVVASRIEAAAARADLGNDPVSIWATVAELSRETELGSRRRFELRRLADLSQVYLQLFTPSDVWSLEEVSSEGDLVWKSGDSVFCDVLVTTAHSAAVISENARRRSNRLLADGLDRVRIVKLTAPLASMLVESRNAPPVLLCESDLWFGPAPLGATDLVAAASGGVS